MICLLIAGVLALRRRDSEELPLFIVAGLIEALIEAALILDLANNIRTTA